MKGWVQTLVGVVSFEDKDNFDINPFLSSNDDANLAHLGIIEVTVNCL